MEIAFLIGRVIVGLFYLFNAVGGHFMSLEMLTQYTASKGVPAPRLAVIVTGLLLVVGGLSIITGLYPAVGVAALVVFLVSTAFIMHNFWTVEDPQMRQLEMTQFLKDLALAGSALMFLAIDTPWPLSLGS